MTILTEMVAAQVNPEEIVNENFETVSWSGVYGKRQPVTTGLTWGYYGGLWGGFTVADGTLTLTASSTNYIVIAIATGVISVSTSSTNWNNNTDYLRAYKLTTNSTTVSLTEDHRAGPKGVHGLGGPGVGGSGDFSSNTATSVDGEAVVFSGTSGKLGKRATGTGLVKRTSGVDSVLPALQCLAIACSDENTALTTGTNVVKFINPHSTAFIVAGVVASLSTAQASGSIFTVDINEAGTSLLSTKLTIDNTETNSSTAATPAVVSDASIAAYGEIEVDIDQIGDGTAKGLKVYILGWPA